MEINSNLEDTTMKINGSAELPRTSDVKDTAEDPGWQSPKDGQEIAKDRESLTQSDEMGEDLRQQ